MSFPGGAGAVSPASLRTAVATIHRDPGWWTKCLLHGALALSVVGIPVAAGFVLESYDNSRKGYPSPLPFWSDPTTRALAGMFALLIDFAFFVLPLLVGLLLLICATIALLIGGGSSAAGASATLSIAGLLAGGFLLTMFLCSVSPAGRLIFVREGRPDEAISIATLRWTTAPFAWSAFARARLASLGAYLPAALLASGLAWLARLSFPGQPVALLALLWLVLSALIYAHLVAVQLYIAAEREAERRRLGM